VQAGNIKEAIELYLEPVDDDLVLAAGATVEKVAM
jgi:predicted DNA-binding protein